MGTLSEKELSKRTRFEDEFKARIKKKPPGRFIKVSSSGKPETKGTGANKVHNANIIIGYSNDKEQKKFIKDHLSSLDAFIRFAKHLSDIDTNKSAYRAGSVVVPYYTPTNSRVQYIKLNDIWKDEQFGGLGGRSPTKKEDDALAKLDRDIKFLCKKNHIPYLDIWYGQKKFLGITGAKTVAGTPKSDFGLVNIDNKIICHISHKDGKTASKFSQWGGMTKKADGDAADGVISKHPEVVQFVRDIHARYPVGSPMPTIRPALKRQISNGEKGKKLKRMAAYGPMCIGEAYNKSRAQRDCVNLILQGTNASLNSGPTAGGITLTKKSGNIQDYIISSDGHNMSMGSTSFGNNYDPVLMIIFKEATRKDFAVKGARFSIFTNGGRGTAIDEPKKTIKRNKKGYGGNWPVKYGVNNWQDKQCKCNEYPAECNTAPKGKI
jgi:hypothetical protein